MREDGRNGKGMFVKGHKHPPGFAERLSASRRGVKTGRPCWSKGLTKETDVRIAAMAANKLGKNMGPCLARRGQRNSIATEFKKGIVPVGGIETRFKTGPDHPLWKGGVTTEHEKIRRGKQYKQWRDAVYARDHYRCKECGKHCEQKDIVAHHIKSFSAYAHLRFTVDNGITLCRRCHLNLHKKEDWGQCAAAI